VFVNLRPQGVTFEEALGKLAGDFHYWYDDVRLIDVWTHEHEVNWKIPVENAVESYHVPMVHPNTYEDYREEELHDHQLEPGFSRYRDLLPYEDKPGLLSLGFRVYTKLFIRNPTFARFTHTHLYPNMLLYYGDIYRNLTVIEPISARRFRFRCFSFVPRDFRFGWIGRRIQDLSMLVFMRMGRRIVGEDVALWPAVQTGLESSCHRGVLSAREERVFAFQQYVCRMLGRHKLQ
jgi:phenylpropionate dioxygenase-like ring-hydroxylating dioxygenase large terminal subunit